MPYKNPEDKKAWRKRYKREKPKRHAVWAKNYYKKVQMKNAMQKRKKLQQQAMAKELKENLLVLKAVMRSEKIKAEATHQEKLCLKCGKIKPFSEMIAKRACRNGISTECKECRAIWRKGYDARNPEVKKRAWTNQHKKIKQDPVRLMRVKISDRIAKAIKAGGQGLRASGSKMQYLGCTARMAANYIENLMQPPMTWANYGTYWHIDHIRPLDSYDLSQEHERYHAFHYTNLQPLSAIENIRKSNQWNKKDGMARQTCLIV